MDECTRRRSPDGSSEKLRYRAMGLFNILSPAASRVPTSAPVSLLERHLCLCRRTKSVGIDRGLSICIIHAQKPQAGRIDPWPATEPEVCKALRWSEERLFLTCIEYIKAHYYRAGEADYLLCRILNECEHRLGQPISRHPFMESVEGVLGGESLVKSLTSAGEPETVIALLKDKYGLGDTVISGRAQDIPRQVDRLFRPILTALARHPKFLYFEVDNEPWSSRRRTRRVSCWLDYTVIHAHFAQRETRITLCVFSHGYPSDREDAYYILTTHHPKIIDYLRRHIKEPG
jgi:hypothetical protein